ncbi:MAG: hypothetical protein U9N35_08090 [Euryarchaeota archaeon]|nr:hypothetical protein [Euryarchaeota archaeon]
MKTKEYFGTTKMFFASSGSMAIFSVLYPHREKIIGIPDQGYFKGILKIVDDLNMKYTLLETKNGLVIPEKIRDIDLFIFSSFSGHIVENNVEKIVSHCKKNNILSVEDISAGVSHPSFGKGDIIVCSTGSPKLLECKWGGFAAYRSGNESELFKYMVIPQGYKKKLKMQIDGAESKLRRLLRYSKILKDFDFDVLFESFEGPSVFIRTDIPKKIVKKLNKEVRPDVGYSLFSRCPRFDRVQKAGFVIETIKVWERDEDEILDIGRKIERVIKNA